MATSLPHSSPSSPASVASDHGPTNPHSVAEIGRYRSTARSPPPRKYSLDFPALPVRTREISELDLNSPPSQNLEAVSLAAEEDWAPTFTSGPSLDLVDLEDPPYIPRSRSVRDVETRNGNMSCLNEIEDLFAENKVFSNPAARRAFLEEIDPRDAGMYLAAHRDEIPDDGKSPAERDVGWVNKHYLAAGKKGRAYNLAALVGPSHDHMLPGRGQKRKVSVEVEPMGEVLEPYEPVGPASGGTWVELEAGKATWRERMAEVYGIGWKTEEKKGKGKVCGLVVRKEKAGEKWEKGVERVEELLRKCKREEKRKGKYPCR